MLNMSKANKNIKLRSRLLVICAGAARDNTPCFIQFGLQTQEPSLTLVFIIHRLLSSSLCSLMPFSCHRFVYCIRRRARSL